MIGKKMQDALNEQIKNELGSAYLYLSMAAYFHSKGLDGMAHWMRVQTGEEEEHALRMFDHVVERDGRVELKALVEPPLEWDSPLAAFQAAHNHEQNVTGMINGLVDLAKEMGDSEAESMLQWFVKEQVEEEESASGVVKMLEGVGTSGEGLAEVDQELGKRK
jgi:ferritin